MSSTLSPDPSAELFRKGRIALMSNRFERAIELLEQYSEASQTRDDSYFRALMWLVKAYHGAERIDDAIALCQSLTEQDHAVTQLWANHYLGLLMPQEASSEDSSDPEAEAPKISDAPASEAVVAAAVSGREQVSGQQASGQNQQASQSLQASTSTRRFLEKTPEDFRTFCRRKLANELLRVEDERNQVVTSLTVATVIGAIAFFFSFKFVVLSIIFPFYESYFADHGLSIYYIPWPLVFISLLCLFSTLWLWFAFCTSVMESYSSGFKGPIVRKIINFLDPQKELRYFKVGDLTEARHAFSESLLSEQPVKILHLRQDSEIRGRLDNVDVIFSDVVAFKERKSWLPAVDLRGSWDSGESLFAASNPIFLSIALAIRVFKLMAFMVERLIRRQGMNFSDFEQILKGNVHHEVVFKGLFFRARFNRTIPSQALILPNTLANRAGYLNRWRGQQVKLEDPEFDRYFTVYGQDQVDARYVLSTALMERLVTFRKKAKRHVSVSFVDNMIYVAVQSGKDAFEPRLFYKMTGFATLREYFENLQLMLGIVEDLKLSR